MAQQTRKVRVPASVKSAGRKLGFAVGETMNQYNPTVSNIFKSSSQATKSVRDSMRKMSNSNTSKNTMDFKKNNSSLSSMLDSLKSSSFGQNTKSVEDELDEYGVSESDFEDWGDDKTTAKAVMSQNENTSKAVISSMGKMQQSISRSVGIASAQSASYIVESNNRASKAIYDMTSSGFNQISTILLDVDNKIDGLLSLGQPIATHIQNSSVFYTKALQNLTSINESLNTLVKRTSYMDNMNPGGKAAGKNQRGSQRYMSGNEFDMSGYLEMVKDNIFTKKDLIALLFGNAQPDKKMKDAGLLQTAINMGVNAIVPKFAKDSMLQFNEALNNAIVGFLQSGGKQMRGSKNGIAKLLGELFFPDDGNKRNINTRNYNKGPVQWDGIARKSLVEVIPTYLAKIYASLGGEEKYFDYSTGKFVTVKTLKAQHKYEEQTYANNAGGDFRKAAMKKAGDNEALKAELDAYFLQAFRDIDKGRKITQNKGNADYMKEFGLSEQSMQILLSLIGASNNSRNSKNLFTNFIASTYGQNAKFAKFLNDEETSGHSSRVYNTNGFDTESANYNKKQNEYLRSIYQMVGNIYGAMGSSGGRRKKGPKNIFNPDTGKFESQSSSGEHSNMDTREDIAVGKYYGYTKEEAAAMEKRDNDFENFINERNKKSKGNVIPGQKGEPKSKFGKMLSKVRDKLDDPFTLVSYALDSLTNGFNALFWGTGEQEGLIDKIGSGFEKIWDKISDSFKNRFKNKAKEKFNKTLGNAIKDEWSFIKEKAKSKYTANKEKFINYYDELKAAKEAYKNKQQENLNYFEQLGADLSGATTGNTPSMDLDYDELTDLYTGNFARGRKVTKTGLAVLSEGELIIPSELNPFYNKKTNKRKEIAKENRISKGLFRTFAGGNITRVGDCFVEEDPANNGEFRYYKLNEDGNRVQIDKEEFNKLTKEHGASNAGKKVKDFAEAAKVKTKEEYEKFRNNTAMKDISGSIVAGVDMLGGGLKDFFTQALFGSKEQMEKDKETVFKSIGNVFEEMGEKKGAMAIGGIAGAGVSLLTGVIGGPLAGAAVGAGLGLIYRSEKVQDALFGKPDENGEYSKPLGNFIMNQLPDLGKGAAIGGAAGLLMGSPILGAIAGTTVSYVKSSESAKKFLFGEQLADGVRQGGIISKEFQQKLKAAAPNLSAGIIGTMGASALLGGPLGIAGSVVVGSAIGLASTSDKFHEFIFGDGKDKKGLAGTIHDKIIGNIDGIFNNFKNSFKGMFNKLKKSVSDIGKNVKNSVSKAIENQAKKSKLFGGFMKVMGAINPITLAGRTLDKVNTRFEKHNLNKGYDVYDKELGRNLSAEEREEKRKSLKLDDGKYGSWDRHIADIENEEDLNTLRDQIKSLNDRKTNYKATVKEALDPMIADLVKSGVMAKDANKLAKLVEKGDEDKTDDILSKYPDDIKEKAGKIVGAAIKKVESGHNKLLEGNAALQYLKKKNVIQRGTDFTTLLDTIDTEKALRFNEDTKVVTKEKDYHTNIIGIMAHIDTIISNARNEDPYAVRGEWKNDLKIALKMDKKNLGKEKAEYDEVSGKYYDPEGNEISKEEHDYINSEYYKAKEAEYAKTFDNAKVRRAEKEADRMEKEKAAREAEADRIEASEEHTRKLSLIPSGIMSDHSDEEESGGASSIGGLIRGAANKAKEKVKEKIVSKVDMFGNVHQYTENNQGEMTEVNNDNETKKSKETINKFTNSVLGIGGISTAIGGLSGMMGKLKEGLLGSEDGKKKGLLDSLFGGLLGENGALSGILSLFTGETGSVKSIVKKILGGGSGGSFLSGVITNIVGPGLLLAGLGGAFDGTASKLTDDAYNETKQKDTKTYTATTKDGYSITYKYDKDGNMVNVDTGEVIDPNDIASVEGSTMGRKSFSDYLKENTARGVLTGTSSVASKVLGKTKVGKAVTKTATAAVGAIEDVAKRAAFTDDILEGVIKFTSKLHNIPGLKFMADKIDDMGLALAGKMEKALASQSAKNIAKFASNAVVWAKIAFIVIDFTTGYEDARTTLGIVKEPTVGQRILSGLLRAIKNFIPIIGTLIPDSLVIDVFCDYIAPALGIDVEELKSAREEAQNTVDQWNQEHGTELSVGDFTKQVMKDYTWMERIKNAGSSTIEDTKAKFNNMKEGIKEKGIGGYLKDSLSDMGSNFMDKYKEEGGGLSGVFAGIGETFGNMLPGIFGEIAQTNMQIRSDAFKGDLKSVWSATLKDFSGGGEDIEGTDLKTAVPGIFSKIVGQIPLLFTKVTMTPVALVSMVGHKLADLFSPVVEKIKGIGSNLGSIGSNLHGYIKSGDITGLWSEEVATDDEDNPLGPVYKVIGTIGKVLVTPTTAVSWVGHKIAEGFMKIVNGVKSAFTTFTNSEQIGEELISGKKSLSEFISVADMKDDDGNPLGGFMKGIAVAGRITSVPVLIAKKIGRDIKNKFDSIVDGIKANFRDTLNNATTLHDISKTGDLGNLWSNEIQVSEDNPLGGFMGVTNFMQKISFTIPTLFSKIGIVIKDKFNKTVDAIKNVGGDVINNATTLHDISKTGSLGDLWSNEIQVSEDNPIGGFMGVANFMQKISFTIPTILRAAGNGIKSAFNSIKDKIVTIGSDVSDNATTLRDISKTGSLGDLWSNEIEVDEDNPLGGFMGVANFVQKLGFTVPTLFHKIGNGIKSGIEAVIGDVNAESSNFNSAVDALKKASEGGEIGKVTEVTYSPTVDGPMSFIFNAAFGINKAFNVAVAAFNKIAKPIKDIVGGITGTVGDIADKVKDVGEDAWNSLKDGVKNVWGSFTDLVTGGHSGLPIPSGGGSSEFVSQYDPRYSNKNISGTSFADKGCGPAVAAMAANAEGKNLSVNNALSASRGYQNPNGVSMDYFANALNRQGISTEYISGGSSADMYSKLARGQNVILLGRDSYNTSKDNSPFGPSNHYVLAKGLDRNGNVIVNDPELRRPRAYSPSILNSASMGIATGGKSGVNNFYRNYSGAGSGMANDDVAAKVWYYFTKAGYSEQATAAIMGNLYQETRMEYTTDVISKKTGKPVTCGIACWDYQNGKSALKEAATKQGKDWKDLSFQLSYLESGMEYTFKTYTGRAIHRYKPASVDPNAWCWWPKKVLLADFKKMTNINEATEIFCRVYERPSKPNVPNRQKFANYYYKKFTGKEGEAITGSSYNPDSSSDSSSSSTNTSSGFSGFLSSISSAFGNAFSKIMGGSNSSDTGTTNTADSNDASGPSGSVPDVDGKASTGGVAKAAPQGNGTAESFINIARSQLGVIEGKENITDYGKFMGTNGAPWCAAFVSWCMDKAYNGDTAKRNKALRGKPSAAVSGLWDNFKNAGAMKGKDSAQAGDIVIYKNGSSHTGLVEAVDSDGKVHTIEGNTSGGNGYERNGGMVARKAFYPKDRSALTGFGRPDWSGASAGSSGIRSYNDICNISDGCVNMLLSSRVGSRNNSRRVGSSNTLGNATQYYYGGASDINKATTSMLSNIKSSATSSKGISPETVSKLIESITNLLNNIANNTAPVNDIYKVLVKYLGANSTTSSNSKSNSPKTTDPKKKASGGGSSSSSSSKKMAVGAEVDSNLQALAGVLAELAKG